MQANKFTHLHVHSEYSLLDGSAKIRELILKTKELGMSSIALTDHGVMFGVIDFYKAAVENGIKPILGCEVYIAENSRFEKDQGRNNAYYHLVLLAENNAGYKNLIKLVSLSFIEGYYYKPRIDMELLREHKEGIIALSGCLSGAVQKKLLNVSYEKAVEQAKAYNDIFGAGNFYLELQDHGIREQQELNNGLIRMHKETGIPLVCTNDIHYINKEDSVSHDILLCIQTLKTVDDQDRMKYNGNQFYVKSPDEMYEMFKYEKSALENTNKIADRCDVTIDFHEYKLPKFSPPENFSAFEYLSKLCLEGLHERYENVTQTLEERIKFEIDVIDKMGFSDYFLIVWDFIKYAKDNGIMVGPGRGSAAGSLVAYCLKITNIDPIKYDLIFERFLNPERISMPDIDIDFCYERRQEVIDYVVDKYGHDRVAQIITFGTMSARAVIRDVGRALAMPYANIGRIAKSIPFELGITIEKALILNQELNDAYRTDEQTKNLLDMSKKLEGLTRHASTHAAGVVISDNPVTEYVPLYKNDGVLTTQFPMNTLEELGLLKMDFLGLRTLTVIQNVTGQIKRNYDLDIDFENIEYNDSRVFELISSAKTEGVFQLESSGMKSFMKDLQPGSLEDIIAGISLYRPGPMEFIPKYIQGKNNANIVKYTHESLEPILKTTYGCIVYQEQVMQIVRELAGYSLGRSDLVRRAMSKKKASVMEEERKNFVYGLGDEVPGCIKNGIPKEVAELIFDEMTDFAKYAFNKSHAAAYAVIGYQTAWLKVYYPVEFMAALLTSVIDSTTKVSEYIAECKKMNIELLPPSVNQSFMHFSCDKGKIRFGLLAIKNVGKNTIEALVKEREKSGKFKSMTEFINRLITNDSEGRDINKRCIESLVKAGAFDELGGKRIQYMVAHRNILNGISNERKRNLAGQMSLFELMDDSVADINKDELPEMEEYQMKELLSYEKEVMGIYISGHPLSEYEDFLKHQVTANSLMFLKSEEMLSEGDFEASDQDKIMDDQVVNIGGIIVSKKITYTKRDNKAMAYVGVEDLYGTLEVIIFPKMYERYSSRLQEEAVVIVNGRAAVREGEESKIICNEIRFYGEENKNCATLWLKIPNDVIIEPDELIKILKRSQGNTEVIVYDESKKKKYKLGFNYWVTPDDELIEQLKLLLGRECVLLK